MLLAPVWASHDTDGIVHCIIYLLGQDYWNKVHHNIFIHLTLLALDSASCDANGIVIGTLVLISQDD